jgi:hypothetical protein
MVGDIISEQRAELSRNGGRLHSGTVGGFGRNPHAGPTRIDLVLIMPTWLGTGHPSRRARVGLGIPDPPGQANALSRQGIFGDPKNMAVPSILAVSLAPDPPALSPATNSSRRRLRERDRRGSFGQAEMRPAGPVDGTDQASRPGHQPGHSRTRQRRGRVSCRSNTSSIVSSNR